MTTTNTIDIAHALLPHLVRAAQMNRIDTYKEFGAAIGEHHRAIIPALYYIRDNICAKDALPPLTALVINGKTRMPGDGFLPDDAKNLPRKEKLALYDAIQRQVCAYAGWDDLLVKLGLTPLGITEPALAHTPTAK